MSPTSRQRSRLAKRFAEKCEVYGGPPVVASTLLQVQRLAFADAMIEIRIIAKAGMTASPVQADHHRMIPRGVEVAADAVEAEDSVGCHPTEPEGGSQD